MFVLLYIFILMLLAVWFIKRYVSTENSIYHIVKVLKNYACIIKCVETTRVCTEKEKSFYLQSSKQ